MRKQVGRCLDRQARLFQRRDNPADACQRGLQHRIGFSVGNAETGRQAKGNAGNNRNLAKLSSAATKSLSVSMTPPSGRRLPISAEMSG